MKKELTITLLAVIAAVSYVSAQSSTQAARWYIAPKFADMTSGIPVATPIPSSVFPTQSQTPFTAVEVANGMYDANNNLLFYVTDGNVYDYNNSLIGGIPNGATEIIICPFGNNNVCQRKFSIFTTSGGQTTNGNTGTINLCQTIVDMNSYSLSTSVIDQIVYQPDPASEFGAIALSKDTNPNNDRYLYFLAGSGTVGHPSGQIKEVLVHQDGSVTTMGAIYPTVSEPNNNAGAEVFAQEMDLSPDGKYLAWANFDKTQHKYHIIQLDNTGGYVPLSYVQFGAAGYSGNTSVSNFRGVEFWDNKLKSPNHELKLFLGAGNDGILYLDIPLANNPPLFSDFVPVSSSGGTNGFGYSQIELANNGNMYASSAPAGYNVGAFNPAIINPSIFSGNPSFTLTNPNPPVSIYSTFYTLPDQIDDIDYSAIVPAPVNPQLTWGSYEFGSGGATTATWTYGVNNNPWNVPNSTSPIIITQELSIKNNSHLTINNMTFRFSPKAKVTIEQGSSLELNGTLFSGTVNGLISCELSYTWQGIEVWGTSSEPQSNLSAQGKLVVQGGSKIENALNAERLVTY